MAGSHTPQPQTSAQWVDFDTLLSERVALLRATGWEKRYPDGTLEPSMRRSFQSRCDAPAHIVRMVGGQMDFQDKSDEPNSWLEVRYRIRLRDSEPIELEDLGAFLNWVHENHSTLKAWVEREKLFAVASMAKSGPSRRASRAL